MQWWLVWQNEIIWDDIYTVSFDHEPTNEDIASSCSNGYNMVGYPVQAGTEEQAIILAFESEH